jgi:putative redox protein
MGDVSTSYDALQHCSAVKRSKNKTVPMDCPYTGKGDEFSPGELVEAALSGCILLSMGAMAMRHEIDLSGSEIDVTISSTDKPVMRFQAIDVQVSMPAGLTPSQRAMLERAAEGCPIKHSFASDIPVSVTYNYPD